MTKTRLHNIVLDCKDAASLSDFYAKLLGWEKDASDPEWIMVKSAESSVNLLFQQDEDYTPPVWPEEPGQQQKSVHLDISVENLEEGIAHAIECGAKKAKTQFSPWWTVMIDPEGHPFCLGEWR